MSKSTLESIITRLANDHMVPSVGRQAYCRFCSRVTPAEDMDDGIHLHNDGCPIIDAQHLGLIPPAPADGLYTKAGDGPWKRVGG